VEDKMIEGGVLLVGGHSIEDSELKYGLSVTGTVHPKRLVTNSGAKAGDKLILTKPLGTGILSTAIKGKMADEEMAAKVAKCMATLNNKAAESMQEIGVHACTDVTGFGLIGHSVEVAQNSRVGINISSSSVPLLPGVEDLALQACSPGGTYKNVKFYSSSVIIADNVPFHMNDILYDPQTSGGLLISLAPRKAMILLDRLRHAGVEDAAIIGEVVSQPRGMVTIC